MTDIAFTRARPLGSRRAFAAALLALLALGLAAQVAGLFLKNVNWDEFIFLKNVYLYLNDDLHRLIQTSFVHLFAWVPQAGASEVEQVVAGRLVMFAAWLTSLVLLYRLGTRHLDDLAALAGVVLFALFSYNQYHAASFRADNLLLPVMLAMVLAASTATPRRVLAAGALGGLGLAISIKAILWAPAVLGLLLVSGIAKPEARRPLLLASLAAGVIALAVFFAILGLHGLSLTPPPDRGVSVTGSNSLLSIFWEMFVAEGLFPRGRLFFLSLIQNVFIWILILAGVLQAIRELRDPDRRLRAQKLLWLATPLLFVAVYHNAWPYAYLVLTPTACLLGGLAFGDLASSAELRKRALAGIVLLLVAIEAALLIQPNMVDRQSIQKQVLGIVHELFPEPVHYIDKTGMVSSFPRKMFTLTVYGLRLYREEGRPAVSEYIAERQPPLLLVNSEVLDVWSEEGAQAQGEEYRLLPEDEAALQATYAPYWGPIYLAGREWRDLMAGEERRFELTFSGDYTVIAEAPLLIDGRRIAPGESLTLEAGAHQVLSLAEQARARLLWGEALGVPAADPPPHSVWGF